MRTKMSFEYNTKTVCAVCQERTTSRTAEKIPIGDFKTSFGALLHVDPGVFPERLIGDFNFAEHTILNGIAIDADGVFGVSGKAEVHVCDRCYGDLKHQIVPEMSIARGRYIPDRLPAFKDLTFVE